MESPQKNTLLVVRPIAGRWEVRQQHRADSATTFGSLDAAMNFAKMLAVALPRSVLQVVDARGELQSQLNLSSGPDRRPRLGRPQHVKKSHGRRK